MDAPAESRIAQRWARTARFFGPQPDQRHWLLQLRWSAVVGQLLTIAVAVGWMGLMLPVVQLLGLVGLTATSNLLYAAWLRNHEPPGGDSASAPPQDGGALASAGAVEFALLLLDLGTLSAMLYLSGGPNNPFVVFYFVNLAVGAILLPRRGAWLLTGLSILGYGLLLIAPPAVQLGTPLDSLDRLWRPIELQGRFVAFVACAAVLTYFISQLAEQLMQRQQQLRAAVQQQANSQRLEALTTLAAGAAHELATPLSTIAVVARELNRHLTSGESPGRLREDLRLIDGELEHCRQVLARMRSSAGDRSAERWDRVTVGDLLDQIVEGIRQPERVDIVVTPDVEARQLWLPLEAVAQAIRNLVHNGLEASPVETDVVLSVHAIVPRSSHASTDAGGKIVFEVRDRGQGMPAEVLERVGEPFFTTKQPGHGTGLGLFLSRNVVQRLGGELEIDSRPDQGTLVRVTVPASESPSAA